MILKQAFIFVLFLTINLCAETVSGILVQRIPPGTILNSTSTSDQPTDITSANKTIQHTIDATKVTPLETTSHDITSFNATVPEPVRINHNRTTKELLQTSTVTTPSTIVPYVTTQLTNNVANTPAYDRSSSYQEVVTQQTKPTPTIQDSNNGKSITMEDKAADSKTTAAGIVALICVGFALTFFISLVAFRFIHKKRHGNREILINEEDVDFTGDDLRHFEATCIQLEPEDA